MSPSQKEMEQKNFVRMQSEYQDTRKISSKDASKESQTNKNMFRKTYTLENNDIKYVNNNNNNRSNLKPIEEIENKEKKKGNKSNISSDLNNNKEVEIIDPKFNTNQTGNINMEPKFNTNQSGNVNIDPKFNTTGKGNINVLNFNGNGLNDPNSKKYSKQNSIITVESNNNGINPLNNFSSKSAQNSQSNIIENSNNNKKYKESLNQKNNSKSNDLSTLKLENKLIDNISNKNNSGKDTSDNNQNIIDKNSNKNNINKEQAKLNTGNYENQILQRINSSDMKEKRKSKILELNSQQMTNNNSIASNIRLSKDQMIKISNEPIQKYYNIISDLGHGSYGMVKKVKHKHIGEERAMKIVRKKLDSQNEIDILKKISHPNIISIYEIFEDSKNYYIMSELLEGGELFEEITRHGSFSEFEAANIMKQILNAVNYMHNKFIVHRDLKPENIMLISKSNSKFEIKIIDFGTAKQFEKGVKLSKFIGTSYYIAPEVLSESYDEKCDVWSCGVILYILLCGYPPFNGASNLDIYHAIKYSPPNFSGEEWKEVSREAIDLIKIMLNKFPQKRYSAEQCMQHKWFSMLSNTDDGKENKEQLKPKFTQLKAINKMSNFVMENRLKQSVLQFISTQFNLKEEERSLRQLFQQFDTEKKGYITYASFYQVLSKYFGENESKLISDKMFENLDLDGSGEISYNEFITAIIDNKSMVTNERLEKTFKMFDKVSLKVLIY